MKSLIRSDLGNVYSNLLKIVNFLVKSGDYWLFDLISRTEKRFQCRSIWNFYGGVGGFKRSLKEQLFDPSYSVLNEKLMKQIRLLKKEGHTIGLHQAFQSWRDSSCMLNEKNRVEKALGGDVCICRQHWLRFSFSETWKAQEISGFRLDMTLGFNETPGFRNSAALRMPTWIGAEKRFSETLEFLPLILMDSHLFDYGQMKENERRKCIDFILDELAFVRGEASVVWHQRVFHADYNWGDDYKYLLAGIVSRGIQCNLE